MLTAQTVAPYFSLSCIAASTALASSGLSLLATPSRMMLPVFGSSFTSSVSGTCLTNTRIFIGGFVSLIKFYLPITAPLMTIRRISLVPSPISSSFASR